MDSGNIRKAREILADAHRIVAFTGAGISAESGIPTFRGDDGLWSKVDVESFGTPGGIQNLLRNDPQRLVGHLQEVANVLLGAKPNAAHKAIGNLEQEGRALGVVTQNVDDLHEQGGTETIYKLHGDLFRWRCLGCGKQQQRRRTELSGLIDELSGCDDFEAIANAVPKCNCGGFTRPDVVLFGEMLPAGAVRSAEDLLSESDCLLVVGTSGVVEPAASFARNVCRRGVPMIEINLEAGALSRLATVSIFAPAGEVLPQLI